jgi:Zn-finger nucleic acid-binding protein
MFLLHFKEVEVDYCERCRGIWLDAGELETLIENANDPFLRLLDHSGTPSPAERCLCPRCDAKLHEFRVNDLVLDRCPRGHGLWFDADELRHLLTMFGASKTGAFLNDLFGTKPTTKTEEPKP